MSTSVKDLIDEGMQRFGWLPVGSLADKRARWLAAINEAERFIAQPASFLYLQRKYPLTIANSGTSVAMPTSPAIDTGKVMTLRIVGQPGYLKYQPSDRFYTSTIATFYDVGEDYPAVWTFMRDASGTMTIYVEPANTTGGNLSFELTAQQAVAPLIDNTSSFSLLPDGYEWTLLLGRAEAQLLRQLQRPTWEAKEQEVDSLLEMFYAGQRTSKEAASTDQEAVQRKRADVELAPDA